MALGRVCRALEYGVAPEQAGLRLVVDRLLLVLTEVVREGRGAVSHACGRAGASNLARVSVC
jgi:hypothetical protein